MSGRGLTQNAVEKDHASRRDAIRFRKAMDNASLSLNSSWSSSSVVHGKLLNYHRVTVLFKSAMAFPSVSHAWVCLLLNMIGVPTGIMDAILTVYTWCIYEYPKWGVFMSAIL